MNDSIGLWWLAPLLWGLAGLVAMRLLDPRPPRPREARTETPERLRRAA